MNDQISTILPFTADVPVADAAGEIIVINDGARAPETVHEKLQDALTPGYQAEFDPAEAEAAGAFREDALSEADALDSPPSYLPYIPKSSPMKTT